jgi:excisionase family DNA binding protein
MSAELRLDGATLRLSDDDLEQLAGRVADLLAEREPTREPWIGAKAAAEHIGAPVSRIHQLVHQGRLSHRKDGARLVFRRSDLDAYLEGCER